MTDLFKLRRIAFASLPFIFSILIYLRHNAFYFVPVTIYAVSSLICFILYGMDKKRSNDPKKPNRIPENTLHFFEFIGGWPGALIAQMVFKHKTQKKPFVTILYFIVFLHLAIWAYYFYR
jgi:uncharacterized membrane protein YsdA (DUF1294 family)